MYNSIACVGSRETPLQHLVWMEKFAADLVSRGATIVSGNALGADQAWARGGNSVDPSKVILCLPWTGYEAKAVVPGNQVVSLDDSPVLERRQLMKIASTHHPAWSVLSAASQKLHSRNVMILSLANRLVGYLNHGKLGGGGTGMAFRLAYTYTIPSYDVSEEKIRLALTENPDKLA